MAQTDRLKDNELILDAVARHPEGATIRQIAASLPSALPHRTLQRRLADLVRGGRLHATGRGRATLYLAAFRAPIVHRAHSPIAEYGTPSLDLSPEARIASRPDARAPACPHAGWLRSHVSGQLPSQHDLLSAGTRQGRPGGLRPGRRALKPLPTPLPAPTPGSSPAACSSTCPGTPADWKATPIPCSKPNACSRTGK